jgi:hypothetical protein
MLGPRSSALVVLLLFSFAPSRASAQQERAPRTIAGTRGTLFRAYDGDRPLVCESRADLASRCIAMRLRAPVAARALFIAGTASLVSTTTFVLAGLVAQMPCHGCEESDTDWLLAARASGGIGLFLLLAGTIPRARYLLARQKLAQREFVLAPMLDLSGPNGLILHVGF